MKLKITLKMLFSLALILVFSTCTETILRDDCASLSEIELTLKATYSTDCEPNQKLPASGAGFKIMLGSDTLFSGNLNSDGIFKTGPIANSNCGLNNVRIEASYRGQSIVEQFGVLCCDTLLNYKFENVWCDQIDPIDCNALDTTIVKTITSSGECLLQNAPFDQMQNNYVIIVAPGPIQINVEELIDLKGKIYLESMSPKANRGIVSLNEGEMLEIYFNVIRDEIVEIPDVTVKLPVACTDEQGNELNSGTISIRLNATVCDPNECYCPFGSTDRFSVFYASESVPVGQSEMFEFTIAELNSGNFGEGCILKIDKISRADGSDAAVLNNHAWTIDSYDPDELLIGDKLSIEAMFTPQTADNFTEEFWVFTSVYSNNDLNNAVNTDQCVLKFKLSGDGCEQICPQLQVLSNNVQLLSPTGNLIDNLSIGEKIEFDSEHAVAQKVAGVMSTSCLNRLNENGHAAFAIVLPNGSYCDDINLKIEKIANGNTNDTEFFNAVFLPSMISKKGGLAGLNISFIPPDLSEHYSSNHNEDYQCAFEIIATSSQNGVELCRQRIEIEAKVEEFSIDSRDVIPMEAFSQVSVQASEPSYHVYNIDKFNETLGNYGIRESLTRAYIDFSGDIRTPLSDHTLYFDVASPNNPASNYNEKPKLFLVNTDGNNYANITANPVANYSTPDAFFDAYESGVLDQTAFGSGTPYSANWTNRLTKAQVQQMGGIAINPGDVYLLWDPFGQIDIFEVNGINREVFCSMAFIYISSVKSGNDNTTPQTGGNGKASVSFYVQYPIKH